MNQDRRSSKITGLNFYAQRTRNHPFPGPDILQAEFNYIAQTAFQANEDRARVTTFYLVNLGGFVAALYSSQVANSPQPEDGSVIWRAVPAVQPYRADYHLAAYPAAGSLV